MSSVMRSHSYGEVVNHQCHLAYALKQGRLHYYTCDTKYHKQCSTINSTHIEFVVGKGCKLYYSL